MSRQPALRPARRDADTAPTCPRNDDCARIQAEATARIVEHLDHLFGPPGAPPEEQGEAMKVLVTLGEVAGKWLRFCIFLRKFGPWLLGSAPIILSIIGAVVPELAPWMRAIASALAAQAAIPGAEG